MVMKYLLGAQPSLINKNIEAFLKSVKFLDHQNLYSFLELRFLYKLKCASTIKFIIQFFNKKKLRVSTVLRFSFIILHRLRPISTVRSDYVLDIGNSQIICAKKKFHELSKSTRSGSPTYFHGPASRRTRQHFHPTLACFFICR